MGYFSKVHQAVCQPFMLGVENKQCFSELTDKNNATQSVFDKRRKIVDSESFSLQTQDVQSMFVYHWFTVTVR